MPIEIKELTKKETKKIILSLVNFNPVYCVMCKNRKGIVQRFFLLNVSVKNNKIHKKVKKLLMNKFGLTYYGYAEENPRVITTAKCPECDNERMEWDY